MSLTDAAGDFLSYTVDVQSLTLARRDGTVVETLPVTTRVNFADYVEMTEFFTGATIPSGDLYGGAHASGLFDRRSPSGRCQRQRRGCAVGEHP